MCMDATEFETCLEEFTILCLGRSGCRLPKQLSPSLYRYPEDVWRVHVSLTNGMVGIILSLVIPIKIQGGFFI